MRKNLVAEVDGDGLGQRNPVSANQAERLGFGRFPEEHGLVHRDENAQNAERNGDAADGQNAAPAIAQTILHDEGQIAEHRGSLLFYRDDV